MQNKISLNLIKSFLKENGWEISDSPVVNMEKAFNETLGLKLYIPSSEEIGDYEEVSNKLIKTLCSIYSQSKNDLINKILLKDFFTLKEKIAELINIEEVMDATQVGDEDTLMISGLDDDWDKLTEMRTKKVEDIITEVKKLNFALKNEK